MIEEFFKFGWNSIKSRKLRSWLTIIGIVVGIAAIVALISVSQGLENAITEQFSKMGVMDIRVTPKGLMGAPIGVVGLTTDDVDVVEGVVGVDYVLGILMQNGNIEFGNEKTFKSVIAHPTGEAEKAFADIDLKFEAGRNFKKGERGSIILGYLSAHDLFKKEIRIGNNVEIEEKKFKVMGIFEESGLSQIDNSFYIPIEDGREIFNKPKEVNVIVAHMQKGVDVDEFTKRIERSLKRARDDENFDVLNPEQILEQMSTILNIVELVLVGIATISLLVGGIGIMNSMYTSVLERTREIGVMKAVGARNSDILLVFLIESGIMGFAGGLIGVVLGSAGALSFGKIAGYMGFTLLLIKVEWELMIFALLFAFIVGMISGVMPAYRASKLRPVDALRYE